ncbi:MAG: S46 family peptidase [Asticcacaulis sp.]
MRNLIAAFFQSLAFVRAALPCLALGLLALLLALPGAAQADEGMWTFDNFPLARVNHAYGLHLDKAWLDHVQASAVRLSVGCSGSVVSPDGLVFTNHHCVGQCAQDWSNASQDYHGYMAATREDEKPCPGMTAEILIRITDVTKDIQTSSTGSTGDAFIRAQNSKFAELEKSACGNDKSLHCQVVTLYQGGRYMLYTYRLYTDVRLVFAPEFQAAFFGGDPDNFNFPRYALDIGFLRLYDKGKPVATPDYLKWSREAPHQGDPVFVAGNPGSTQRLMTAAQLETLRDKTLPVMQTMRSELRGRMIRFSEESAENRRVAADSLFGLENAYKAYYGEEQALIDPATLAAKRKEEAYLKSTLKGTFKARIGNPWADVEKVQTSDAELYLPFYCLETAPNSSQLLLIARWLVRAAAERQKPSVERLPEYTDARLPGLEKAVMSPAPISKALDELILEFRLSKAREFLTADAPETRLLLGTESPENLAAALVGGTRLDDVAERQRLWDGGWAAIQASNDPMIQYALKIDPAARDIRKQYESRVTGPVRMAAQKIAQVRFRAYGTGVYPDATFSPRLSYGKVAGWTYRGVTVPAFTEMKGLYDRATGQLPYVLAKHFADAEGKYDGNTVFDFVTSNDIAGGNSGSPAINARGEVIGAVFDGNIHSLGGAFVYDGALNRAVVVSSAAVTVALDKVYGDQALLQELTGAR